MPTSRRIYRVAKVLHQRQNDLIIALDEVHDPHNVAAVVRTADATGVGKIIWELDVYTSGDLNQEISKGSERWVQVEKVDSLVKRLEELKKDGFNIAATHLGKESVDFRSLDWTKPWVLVMGNEQRGCSNDIAELADKNIALPMLGFVQSLNISVATAVALYEIQRQRENAGMYMKEKNSEEVKQYFDNWQLGKDDFTIEQIMKRPEGYLPCKDPTHEDGRSVRKVPLKSEI